MAAPPSVLVVGSINVDIVVRADRLPARGETVAGGRLERTGGGKGANQAVAAARAGAAVALVGAVGDDELGADALAELRSEGVDVSAVRRLGGVATGVALIVVDRDGDNQIAVASGANHELMADHVRDAGRRSAPRTVDAAGEEAGRRSAPRTGDAAGDEADRRPAPRTGDAAVDEADRRPAPRAGDVAVDRPGCVLASFELRDAPVLAAAKLARAAGCPLIVNPAPARPLEPALRALQPILTPNRHEAAELTGEVDPEAAARALSADTGAPVVITLGEHGALVVDAAGSARVEAPTVRAVDTTGAGDVFNGVLAVGLAHGLDLRAAVTGAVDAAARSVTRAGARG